MKEFGRARVLPSPQLQAPDPERLGGSLALPQNDQRMLSRVQVLMGAVHQGTGSAAEVKHPLQNCRYGWRSQRQGEYSGWANPKSYGLTLLAVIS